MDAHSTAADEDEAILGRLGIAVIDLWSELPQDLQRRLFEAAAAGSPKMPLGERRQRIATFLHDHKRPEWK